MDIGEATLLIGKMRDGDRSAGRELYDLLYSELHGRARGFMRDQGADHTLQATALVNEAWLKLERGGQSDWESRRHFLGVATTAMRSVLVDHARARATSKRGGDRARVDVDDFEPAEAAPSELRILVLDEALQKIAAEDEQCGRVCELRLFGGLDHQEIAKVLGVSTRTVERAWKAGRDALKEALS